MGITWEEAGDVKKSQKEKKTEEGRVRMGNESMSFLFNFINSTSLKEDRGMGITWEEAGDMKQKQKEKKTEEGRVN